MNNLKRVLSLALAGTMLAGMMVVGASAADYKDFKDSDEIQHTEAVSVMATLGVLNGKNGGVYDPNGTVTRAEMAKIICVMRNGGVDPTLGSGTSSMFTDTADHWARGYIEYCANLGIINGMGDGTFRPDAPVTGAQAAKMLLVALGYDSDVFGFTGRNWQANVDREANEAKLYDEIKHIDTSAGLSRDDTAQMAYNALDAFVMDRSYDKLSSSGEITYKYAKSETETFLNKYFDAYTFIGTFEGNKDTGSSSVSGEIAVYGRLDTVSAVYDDNGEVANNRTARFPSDLDISNIGEEVKVIFKDGKSGTSNVPDKNDTIYGVFNTGKTEVYHVTKNDIQDAESSTKVKFGDVKYDVASTVKVITNYVTDNFQEYTDAKELQKALKVQSADTIKFVCDDNGKINAAYVVEYNMAKVTSVSSSKVALSGVGSIDIDDNNIYDGIAKDDVVVYTAIYNKTVDKDDSTFTVTKAETVEGVLTGYKTNEKVTVDGTTYKVNNKALLTNLTDDAVASSKLGDKLDEEVTLYFVGGLVGAIDAPDSTTNNYALITGSNGGDVDADYDALNVKVRLADGTTAKYDVHKDSTYDGTNDLKGNEDKLVTPALVKYTMSGDQMKIKEIAATGKATTAEKLWNKTTKALNYDGAKTAVAASDAVLYVYVKAPTDKYYVYDLRSLGNIAKTGDTVQYFMKDGQIVAAYVELDSKPGSSTADTLYGLVTGYNGTRKDDDDTYQSYSIWTGSDTEVWVENDEQVGKLTVGNIVTFDETSDGKYDVSDFTVISTYDDSGKVPVYTFTDSARYMAVAVDSYNSGKGILTYFTGTKETADNTYEGVGSSSITVDDDVVIVYVDADEQEEGADNGVASFDSTTGNANAILHLDSDGVVDAIIVETSGELSLNSAFPITPKA